MLAAVEARLEAQVPELTNRVRKAKDFASLIASGRTPASPLVAYVVPTGLQGQPAQLATGYFAQPVVRGVSVILMLQSASEGQRALERLDAFLEDVYAAICGWAPGDEVGVFEIARAAVVPSGTGVLNYQIDFRINDQLRIST